MTQIKREKSTSSKGHYVTNAVLLPEVLRAKELGVVTQELMSMISMIAEKYSRKYNFVGYSFREDMVNSAIDNLCVNALKFDLNRVAEGAKPNPFAYYTSAIHNSFLQYMSEEKMQRNIRDALLTDAGFTASFGFTENGEGGGQPTRTDMHKPVLSDRPPSELKVYSKDDYSYDPVTGKVTFKTGELICSDPLIDANGKKRKIKKYVPPKKRIPFQKKKVAEPTSEVEIGK